MDILLFATICLMSLLTFATYLTTSRLAKTVDRLELLIVPAELSRELTRSKVEEQARTLRRMEDADAVVAEGRIEIAKNLADSVRRADATVGPEGAAADAALRTGDSAEEIVQRQSNNREIT